MRRAVTSPGFKKARVGVARKPAVVLHAMWKTNTPSVGAQLPRDRELAAQTASNGASPPERMARIRPTQRMPITAHAMTRAWTTSADPPSDANMRRPLRQTAKRTLNRARRCHRSNEPLMAAIRELRRGSISSAESRPDPDQWLDWPRSYGAETRSDKGNCRCRRETSWQRTSSL